MLYMIHKVGFNALMEEEATKVPTLSTVMREAAISEKDFVRLQ